MALGEIDEDRVDQYIPLTAIRDDLAKQFTLMDTPLKTGGPARYVKVKETRGILGCTGQIYTCLGHGGRLDLREAIRGENPIEDLDKLLKLAMHQKPEKHNFDISDRGAAPAVDYKLVIVGTGFAGLGLAAKLREQGIEDLLFGKFRERE